MNSRNGYRPREWDTRAGTVELAVPKLRHGSYFPSFLEHRRRAERALASVVATSYLLGVSTRRVEKLAASLGVTGLSKSQVSAMAAELDEIVEGFRCPGPNPPRPAAGRPAPLRSGLLDYPHSARVVKKPCTTLHQPKSKIKTKIKNQKQDQDQDQKPKVKSRSQNQAAAREQQDARVKPGVGAGAAEARVRPDGRAGAARSGVKPGDGAGGLQGAAHPTRPSIRWPAVRRCRVDGLGRARSGVGVHGNGPMPILRVVETQGKVPDLCLTILQKCRATCFIW